MFEVSTFYRFASIADPAALRDRLAAAGARHGVRGTILVAQEGLNGTIAGTTEGVSLMLAQLRAVPCFGDMPERRVKAPALPFGRLKVKHKREIVTMGIDRIDPARRTGRHVAPAEWNAILRDPATVVIDTRNAFEVAMGSFDGALDPGLRRFRDFPAWWADRARDFSGRRVAMFCTGGIRCEKATAYALDSGAAEVVHLKGGILAYLDATPPGDSLWRGDCFVFDERIAEGY